MVREATQPRRAQPDYDLVGETASTIRDVFAAYHDEFKRITRRAKERFEQRDWHGLHEDALRRLDLYREFVTNAVDERKESMGERAGDTELWKAVKQRYIQIIAERNDFELAESFYNSVAMRLPHTHGIDPEIHFTGTEFKSPPPVAEKRIYRSYEKRGSTKEIVRDILADCRFGCRYQDLDRSAELAAGEIDSYLQSTGRGEQVEQVDIANSVFYRGKAAYLVGRIATRSRYVPLVLALLNNEHGIYVDAVLLTEDEVSIVFSFARSYFHVEAEIPYAMVRFLKAIMPLKPIAELYISLGHNKHGKTELYRDLMRHMERSKDKFVIARGEPGMVMVVFTLPSYDVVFKVIKDFFDYPKTTTPEEVRQHYYLVFRHDRGGRLVDAQEFEYLRFDKDRFSPELLEELLRVAKRTVSVENGQVEIKHLYTERRLTPLNLYLDEVDEKAAVDAVVDYGQTIKDLATTNIFPGDILLKNFGVTRHGRIVFYDYDELCLLTDCVFRDMPESDDPFDEMSSETWFSVGEQDVFPEELRRFLGLSPPLRKVFTERHGDLFGVEFWQKMQSVHKEGEVTDVFPYREERRLPQPALEKL